jgi:hypothetical protein
MTPGFHRQSALPAATPRMVISRSVMTPTKWPLSTTGRIPTSSRRIICAASLTFASRQMDSTSQVITSLHSMVPFPAKGWRDDCFIVRLAIHELPNIVLLNPLPCSWEKPLNSACQIFSTVQQRHPHSEYFKSFLRINGVIMVVTTAMITMAEKRFSTMGVEDILEDIAKG